MLTWGGAGPRVCVSDWQAARAAARTPEASQPAHAERRSAAGGRLKGEEGDMASRLRTVIVTQNAGASSRPPAVTVVEYHIEP